MIVLRIKKNKHKCNFRYVAIPMITSQTLKSVNFTKTQKSRYIENKTFLLQMKKFIYYRSSATLLQKKYFSGGKAVVRRCSVKQVFLEIFQKSQENICSWVSFLIKLQGLRPATLLKKETLAQLFSCEFCEISNNTFSYRTPPVGASLKD